MATLACKTKVSIDILDEDTVETSSAKQVFRTVNNTLALVREKIIDDNDSMQLSQYCSNVRKVLKTAVQGRSGDTLDESVKVALEDLGRVTEEIEWTLRRGANTPRTKHNKSKVEGQTLKTQETLGVRNVQSAPLDPICFRGTATTSIPESACGHFVRRTFAPHDLPSLIEVIFSSKDESDTIRRLLGDDAQAFVDVVDEALDRPDISSRTRDSCLQSLYRMCSRYALLPTSLKIPVSYERADDVSYRGGFADVWKREHCGRDVAVKVIRIYSDSDLQRVVGKFCKEVVGWKTLRHPNVLPLIGVTMSRTQFAMISDWMANGSINSFVKAHPDVNRLELLRGVARGLIYIHGRGMIHGDLKGANILIDQTGHARLADFGLLTIISDPKYLLSSSSHTQGGTVRWMSPERIAPERFGFKSGRPTIPSDCYALGMVIYETISGNLPFHKDADLTVFIKVVVEGKHPPREIGFMEILWEMLELCWAPQPNNRPSIEAVLQCLEMVSTLSMLPSGVDEETDEGGDDGDSASSSSSGDSLDFFDTADRVQLSKNDSLRDHYLTNQDDPSLPGVNRSFPNSPTRNPSFPSPENEDDATRPYNPYNLPPASVIAIKVGSEPQSPRSLSRALNRDDSDYLVTPDLPDDDESHELAFARAGARAIINSRRRDLASLLGIRNENMTDLEVDGGPEDDTSSDVGSWDEHLFAAGGGREDYRDGEEIGEDQWNEYLRSVGDTMTIASTDFVMPRSKISPQNPPTARTPPQTTAFGLGLDGIEQESAPAIGADSVDIER